MHYGRSAGFDICNPWDIGTRTRVDRYSRVQQCAASKQKMRSSVYTAGRSAVRPSVRATTTDSWWVFGRRSLPAHSRQTFLAPFSSRVLFFFLPISLGDRLPLSHLSLAHWKAWRPNEDVSTRAGPLVYGRAFVFRPSLSH